MSHEFSQSQAFSKISNGMHHTDKSASVKHWSNRSIGLLQALVVACFVSYITVIATVFMFVHTVYPTLTDDGVGNYILASISNVSTGLLDPTRRQDRPVEVLSLRKNVKVGNKDEKNGLSIAWLMSFPNSGTSYTIHLIREISNSTTATNYGLEGDIKDEESVPVFKDSKNGPFLELIKTIQTDLPAKNIMTKTHCGGFCSDCRIENYIETARSFQMACLTGQRGVTSADGKGIIRERFIRYNPTRVKKSIHVIRNPMDNVVARFHLYHKRYQGLNNNEWVAAHPYNQTGFQTWCRNLDKSRELVDSRWVDSDLEPLLNAVPCHAEFFRYFQWHNLAFSMSQNMNLPTMVLHYEDYRNRFEETVTELLRFLELPRVSGGSEFLTGKEYFEYYTAEQKKSIEQLAKELSIPESWANLNRYF